MAYGCIQRTSATWRLRFLDMAGSYHVQSHGSMRCDTQKPCDMHVVASRDHQGAHTAFLEHGAAGNMATVDDSAHGKRQVFTEPDSHREPRGRRVGSEE